MNFNKIYDDKLINIEDAAKKIKSNDRMWISAGNCIPKSFVDTLCKRFQELENVNIYSTLVMYALDYLKPEYKGHLNAHTFFMGGYERMFYGKGNLDVGSVQVSQIGNYIEDVVKPNVAALAVSPPDENGNMFYGPFGVVGNQRAVDKADVIIVQVNKNIPRVNGNFNVINVNDVDIICEADDVITELPNPPVSDIDKSIASYIVPLIPDGSTIQIGIGGTSNAVAYGLEDKKDLGVHTEMLTDSIVHLIKAGAVNNSKKNYKPRKSVFTFAAGSNELYDYINNNEDVFISPCDLVNTPNIIAQNDNLMSINNGLMIDLTGQVTSEAIGHRQFSGTGGQLDFVIGATMSKGGKSFITIPAVAKTKTGLDSRIKLALPEGTAVTTPRSYVQYIITEYGIADLKNKSFSQRAKALIEIAHPDFREALTIQAKEIGLI